MNRSLVVLLVLLPCLLATPVTVGNNQNWDQSAFESVYSLGRLYVNQTITVSISYTAATAVQIDIKLFDDSSYDQTVTCTVNPCIVTFPKITAANDYQLYINPRTYSMSQSSNSGQIYISSLDVFGNDASRSNNRIFQGTVAFGSRRFHRIYIPSQGDYQITLEHININTNSSQRSFMFTSTPNPFVFLVNQTDSVTFTVDTTSTGSSAQNLGDTQSMVIFNNVEAGYYWIVFDVQFNSPATALVSYNFGWNFKASYQTQKYVCPFAPEYPDLTGIFQGCIHPSSNSNLPCLIFNEVTQQCDECLEGYTLNNGRCIQDSCPQGFYKRYGKCLENPIGCASYDAFAKCQECKETYALSNGQCNRIPLQCADRTYYNEEEYTCSAVSDKCDDYNAQGQCTSCKDIADHVVDGECVLAVTNCGERQYSVNGQCFPVKDQNCGDFEPLGGKCKSCLYGFQFDNNGVCQAIECPDRFHPDEYGNCKQVSALCEQYNIYGFCLKCIAGHGPNKNGECLQFLNPYPCPAREYLGFDNNCHTIKQNCKLFNEQRHVCEKCQENYYLLYTGLCVVKTRCGARQYLVNNDCHDVSPTCGNYDRDTGACLNCRSDNYELYLGLCIPSKKCGSRQWVDENGNCLDVNPRCDGFNPASGACTSCQSPFIHIDGACCQSGERAINGDCIPAEKSKNLKSNDHCVNKFNGFYCVECEEGYQAVAGECVEN